ncbi:MAG: hypothetical protein M3O90_04670 [Actinomycetota bacterium]|nr:hypothetical protein [Actinomycetota bacterium]
MLRGIEPVFFLGSLIGLAIGVAAAASDTSILVVYAGIAISTLSLIVGWDREDQRRRSRR